MNIFINGATSDIGYNLAIKYASLGYNLYLTYHNNYKKALELKDEILSNYSVSCIINYLDLHDEQSILDNANKFKQEFNKLDILVNNSAIYCDNLILDKSKKEFMNVLEVNVVGNFLLTKYLIDYLDNGSVINLSSTDGIDTYNEYNIDYAVSKAAIIQMNRSFAYSFKNIKFVCLAPNWINTGSTNQIDKEYLNKELKRINQEKLIEISTVVDKIVDCASNTNIKSGECVTIYE